MTEKKIIRNFGGGRNFLRAWHFRPPPGGTFAQYTAGTICPAFNYYSKYSRCGAKWQSLLAKS